MARPARTLGGPHTTFWDYCNRDELRLQRCRECSSYMWPPAPICDTCLSDALTWTNLSGKGKIATYCVFERQYYPECPVPWPVVLVQLDEGPQFISNPHDIALGDLHVGLPVEVAFIDCEDRHGPFRLPVFQALTSVHKAGSPA